MAKKHTGKPKNLGSLMPAGSEFDTAAATAPEQFPAQTKLMLVGGTHGEKSFLRNLLPILHNAGLVADKNKDNLGISEVNIDPEHGGRDFLQETNTTGVLVLCNLPPRMQRYQTVDANETRAAFMRAGNSCYDASLDQWDKEKWQERIQNSGARAIVINGKDGPYHKFVETDDTHSFQLINPDDKYQSYYIVMSKEDYALVEPQIKAQQQVKLGAPEKTWHM